MIRTATYALLVGLVLFRDSGAPAQDQTDASIVNRTLISTWSDRTNSLFDIDGLLVKRKAKVAVYKLERPPGRVTEFPVITFLGLRDHRTCVARGDLDFYIDTGPKIIGASVGNGRIRWYESYIIVTNGFEPAIEAFERQFSGADLVRRERGDYGTDLRPALDHLSSADEPSGFEPGRAKIEWSQVSYGKLRFGVKSPTGSHGLGIWVDFKTGALEKVTQDRRTLFEATDSSPIKMIGGLVLFNLFLGDLVARIIRRDKAENPRPKVHTSAQLMALYLPRPYKIWLRTTTIFGFCYLLIYLITNR